MAPDAVRDARDFSDLLEELGDVSHDTVTRQDGGTVDVRPRLRVDERRLRQSPHRTKGYKGGLARSS